MSSNRLDKSRKISKIAVKNLFGIFNHIITLPSDSRIRIITGPNGYGKTIILSMVNGLFAGNYSVIRSVPFDELSINFESGEQITLKKKAGESSDESKKKRVPNNIVVSYSSEKNPETKFPPFAIPNAKEIEENFPLGIIDDYIPNIMRVGRREWMDGLTNERLSLIDVIERYRDDLPSNVVDSGVFKPYPEWLKNLKDNLNVRFIQTERLRGFPLLRTSRHSRYEEQNRLALTVMEYSKELASSLQEKLAEYGSFSQSLDRSLPTRLLDHEYSTDMTEEDIQESWDQLEKIREELIDNGLLEKEETPFDSRAIGSMDQVDRRILSVYVKDIESKLNVFVDLNVKIKLFLKLINKKFMRKKMLIDRHDGFYFQTDKHEILPSFRLSSGEQHEVVMLYELLFKVGQNSLILIDEPELSLHVYWQQHFLEDLDEITKLTDFDILIATHSPEIIQDRWDLTLELKGPGDD